MPFRPRRQLYWVGLGDQLLHRANLDASNVEQVAIGTLPPDAWLALRGGVRTTDGDVIITFRRGSPRAAWAAPTA